MDLKKQKKPGSIYVSRDDEGNIIKAEKITPKEILQKKADEE